MIGRLAGYIAVQIYDDKNKYLTLPKIKFALHFFLNLFFVFITVLLVSFIFDNTYDSIICFFGLMFLRFISGGSWHFKNDVHCYLFSSLILVAIPLIPIIIKFPENASLTLNLLSLAIIIILAPVSKRNLSSKRKWIFKIISISTIMTQIFIINSPVLSLAFIVQSISILPINYRK